MVGSAAVSLVMTSPNPAAARPAQAAPSATTVQVKNLGISQARPVVGSTVAVTGRIAVPRQARTARTVTLQTKTTSKKWRTVARSHVKGNGTFRFARPVTTTGRRTFRVVVTGKQTKRTVSRSVVVNARAAKAPAVRRVTPFPAAPVVPLAGSSAVRDELGRTVVTYRAAHGRRAAGTNVCLDDWATYFADRMATTGFFVHSGAPDWRVQGPGHVRLQIACVDQAPDVVRQEAIAHVTDLGPDAAPSAVAAAAFAELTSWWAHDDVLLDDFGSERVMSVGVAHRAGDGWYVVIAFAAA
ncbi:hypothetical protein [Nocardioides yefusunii]|uniref:CAP domain-containing protein n=1 Tax=Nocardioides yefusunii TaxID=2500546 RepID=A0ABW1R2Y1_9ACTN|nr:hypothetical protein [Nocardioides yefusunii]